jgi:hypothetical protein
LFNSAEHWRFNYWADFYKGGGGQTLDAVLSRLIYCFYLMVDKRWLPWLAELFIFFPDFYLPNNIPGGVGGSIFYFFFFTSGAAPGQSCEGLAPRKKNN